MLPEQNSNLPEAKAQRQKTNYQACVEEHPELQISISRELFQELLTSGAIKACQIRCLNAETADILKLMCMDCCAKNLFRCSSFRMQGIDRINPITMDKPSARNLSKRQRAKESAPQTI